MKLSIISLGLSTLALILFTFQYLQPDQQKIAYVYVDEVLAEYHAMQDVNDRLKLRESEETRKLDVSYQNLQTKINWLQTNYSQLTADEIAKKQQEIANQDQTFREMEQKVVGQLDSLKSSWVAPIYEEVNQYIKSYSRENGYDYVLGNLGNGNIMYATDASDITLAVIDGINVAYNKENID